MKNPADFASRGLETEEIRNKDLWWYGPEWLLSQSDSWPKWKLKNMDSETFDNDSLIQNESEMLPKSPMYDARLVAGEGGKQQQDVATKRNTPLTIDIHRFPSLTRLLRVTALAQKFICKLKRTSRSKSYLDSEEINQAETLWTRYVQEYTLVMSLMPYRRTNATI